MGCYPLFACQDWSQLARDMQDLEDDLVSLALVTDPFGEYDEPYLRHNFDIVFPFKEHYVADLQHPIDEIVSRHHRYYARKALESIHIETCEEATQYVDEWTALYAVLTDRHNVRGVRAFSRTAFLKQMSIPGLMMFRAIHQGTAMGAALCIVQGDVAYGHLMGISEVGHKLGVSYALYWSNLQYFSGKVRWLDWGGNAGSENDGQDGLSNFKRGFSTGTRSAYFCGRILNPKAYSEIMTAKGIASTGYFPGYRRGEFAREPGS